jgi:hypothetical protein
MGSGHRRCSAHVTSREGHSIWLAGDSTLMYLRCCSWWCQIGVKAHALCWGQWGSNPHEFRVRGRWDRNRTCNLRFWSLLPFVQQRSGTYTNTLEMSHFDGPKYVDVHQRSPALGSTLGSHVGDKAFSICVGKCEGRAVSQRASSSHTPSRHTIVEWLSTSVTACRFVNRHTTAHT